MKSYKNIVEDFQSACDQHIAIKFFADGSLDKLDATSQNVTYPFAFLRPLTSPGIDLNAQGISGQRTLTFELYMMDVPKLTDSDYTSLMSDLELYLYDVIAWFNLGSQQQDYQIGLNNISPLNEAFEDRVCGWVGNLTILTPYVLDYCNFPDLP